jgi:hypothetical protein
MNLKENIYNEEANENCKTYPNVISSFRNIHEEGKKSSARKNIKICIAKGKISALLDGIAIKLSKSKQKHKKQCKSKQQVIDYKQCKAI